MLKGKLSRDKIIIFNKIVLSSANGPLAELHKCSQSAQPRDRYGLWHMCWGLNHPNTAVMGQKTETTHPHHSQTISAFAMKTDWTHGFASHCFV